MVKTSAVTSWILFFICIDDSLTVDNVTEVMEMITDDNFKEVWGCLRVPVSLVEMITRNLSTKKQKTQACVVFYLNYSPYMYTISWRDIAETLYSFDEMVAAREARTFLHKKGR